ncbi:MAG: hypothetical protein J6K55_01290, partial [Clostridia bacterium]|nr:hypothetical protein [Clostridia bacterium]
KKEKRACCRNSFENLISATGHLSFILVVEKFPEHRGIFLVLENIIQENVTMRQYFSRLLSLFG